MSFDPQKQIDEYLELYSSYNEADLIRETKKWEPYSAQHIAASQLISKIKNASDDKRHMESIAESRKSNTLSIWAISIALISLIVSVGSLSLAAYIYLTSKEQTQQPVSQKPPETSLVPPSDRHLEFVRKQRNP